MRQQHLHIICFDIPYPATYGGVIDVFYTIQALSQACVAVTLHCFYKNELHRYAELEGLCREVYYYRRDMSFRQMLHCKPFAVCSRRSSELLTNLLKDDSPILFEGLVSCALLDHPSLKGRRKIFRESNIEHDYYFSLSRAARQFGKRLYYLSDAIRLRSFEKCVRHSDMILAVAHQDEAYFRSHYPAVPTYYLPSFHPNAAVNIPQGKGDYILYHGNLDVSENYNAAIIILREIASRLPQIPFILAGRYHHHLLDDMVRQMPNVTLIANPDSAKMDKLVSDAQIHLLYTEQATGLKLKLLNVLYQGRHVVVNDKMVTGTDVAPLCHIGCTTEELTDLCRRYYGQPVSDTEQQQRIRLLAEHYDNTTKIQKLIATIF